MDECEVVPAMGLFDVTMVGVKESFATADPPDGNDDDDDDNDNGGNGYGNGNDDGNGNGDDDDVQWDAIRDDVKVHTE